MSFRWRVIVYGYADHFSSLETPAKAKWEFFLLWDDARHRNDLFPPYEPLSRRFQDFLGRDPRVVRCL